MKDRGAFIRRGWVVLAWLYFVGVWGWALLYSLFVDRWGWLFLINSFATFLFVPLPAIVFGNLWGRGRSVWFGIVITFALFAWLFGGLFVPKSSPTQASAKPISVMTYNMLGFNTHIANVVQGIREANADVVGIQELSLPAADALHSQLKEQYPHQILAPDGGVAGMGVLSRFPIRAIERYTKLGEDPAQLLSLDIEGQEVIVVNIHYRAPSLSNNLLDSFRVFEQSKKIREDQVRETLKFAAQQSKPLIVLADFNTTERSTAYQLMTRDLRDVWREVGWGFGHSWWMDESGISLPIWAARIDYVFYSQHWRAEAARLGRWDGMSDHRSVIAQLRLLP